MEKLTPPEQLNLESGNLAENWRTWRHRFEVFSIASGLSEKSERVQVATLLHVAGPKALEVYNAFTWDSEGDEHKIGKILEKFETYCKPRKNVTMETEIHPIGHKLKKETAKPPCTRCGLRHTPYQICPAQGAECYKCGRKNHFAKVCKTSLAKQPLSNVHAV